MAAERRPPAEAHIAECEECRVLVSAVMRSSLIDPSERLPASRPSTEVEKKSDPAMDPTTPLQGSSGRGPVSVPVRPGEILAGKYEVERVLGAGGMGIVVAARHTQLDQRFALKFLLPAAYEAPGAVERFVREGKAAARITSEHVARVVDTGVLDSGAPYLVMEYLDGSDLGELAAKRGRLQPSDAIEYVLQAGEAIVEAHELGIVHRDLKPANLFLTQRKDGSPLVKVLDFGISKAAGGSSHLTSTSTLMGSPRYMSPEQMVSAKDVDARTDVWALGVILHELVSGRPVWEADTVQGLCALIATAPAPPLRQVAPETSAALEAVVLRCLEKAPRDRIASVADLALALEPLAPERARTSIDRILGIARRKRADVSTPPQPARAAVSAAPSATTSSAKPSGAGGRTVLALTAVVGLLVVLGILLNTMASRRSDEPKAARTTESSANPTASSATPSASIASTAASTIPSAPSANTSASPVASVAPEPKAAPARLRTTPPRVEGTSRALSERK